VARAALARHGRRPRTPRNERRHTNATIAPAYRPSRSPTAWSGAGARRSERTRASPQETGHAPTAHTRQAHTGNRGKEARYA
jgi:hypothetical protein